MRTIKLGLILQVLAVICLFYGAYFFGYLKARNETRIEAQMQTLLHVDVIRAAVEKESNRYNDRQEFLKNLNIVIDILKENEADSLKEMIKKSWWKDPAHNNVYHMLELEAVSQQSE